MQNSTPSLTSKRTPLTSVGVATRRSRLQEACRVSVKWLTVAFDRCVVTRGEASFRVEEDNFHVLIVGKWVYLTVTFMPSCLSPCCQLKKKEQFFFWPVMLFIHLKSFRVSCQVLQISAVEISPIYCDVKSKVMSRSKSRDPIMQENPWIFFLSSQLHHITVQQKTCIKREAHGCDRPGCKHRSQRHPLRLTKLASGARACLDELE